MIVAKGRRHRFERGSHGVGASRHGTLGHLRHAVVVGCGHYLLRVKSNGRRRRVGHGKDVRQREAGHDGQKARVAASDGDHGTVGVVGKPVGAATQLGPLPKQQSHRVQERLFVREQGHARIRP